MQLPLLLCHGTGDLITSYRAAEELAQKLQDVDLKLFPGGYHELHNDLDKEKLFTLVLGWIDNTLKT